MMIFDFGIGRTYAPASSVVRIRPRTDDKPGCTVEYTDETTHNYSFDPSTIQTLPNTSQLEAVCVAWYFGDDSHRVEHWPILAWRVKVPLDDELLSYYADPILHREPFSNEILGVLNPATGTVDVVGDCTYDTVEAFVAGTVEELKHKHAAKQERIEAEVEARGKAPGPAEV